MSGSWSCVVVDEQNSWNLQYFGVLNAWNQEDLVVAISGRKCQKNAHCRKFLNSIPNAVNCREVCQGPSQCPRLPLLIDARTLTSRISTVVCDELQKRLPTWKQTEGLRIITEYNRAAS